MQQQTQIKKEKGFTLLEVVVSLAIISVSIVMILQLFSGGLRSIKVSDDYLRAAILAQNKMNELETMYSIFKNEKGVFEEDDRYNWSLTVENYELADLHPQFNNLKDDTTEKENPVAVDKITLKVLWDTKQEQRKLELVTLKAQVNVKSAPKMTILGTYSSSLISARGFQFNEQDLPEGQSEIDYEKVNVSGRSMLLKKPNISGSYTNKTNIKISGN